MEHEYGTGNVRPGWVDSMVVPSGREDDFNDALESLSVESLTEIAKLGHDPNGCEFCGAVCAELARREDNGGADVRVGRGSGQARSRRGVGFKPASGKSGG